MNPRTGRCWQYNHEERHMATDPIQEADQDALEMRREQQRMQMDAVSARFRHHPPTDPTVISAHEQARRMGEGFALWLLASVPDCPERAKAIDAIDLATMHANAAIARTQLDIPSD
jgi:hypothetical protein